LSAGVVDEPEPDELRQMRSFVVAVGVPSTVSPWTADDSVQHLCGGHVESVQLAAAGVAALRRGERGRGGDERVLVDREVLERLSGAVEATLERAQRRERAGERPLQALRRRVAGNAPVAGRTDGRRARMLTWAPDGAVAGNGPFPATPERPSDMPPAPPSRRKRASLAFDRPRALRPLREHG
jgi:hypothetical protein